MSETSYDELSREELIHALNRRDAEEAGGLRLHYKGQSLPWRIVRMVKPRRQKIEPKLCVGSEEDQACNLIVEGENLQAMVSLYKYRGQVDLIIADPPYNTGRDFRYNDRWDSDPNDPDLGPLVSAEDGSKHSKWLRFMVPRLWAMKEMLRPSGVLAVCIDHRELYRLGMVLDDVFGESNRLAVINWQKTTSKSDASHVAITTEYVLVYAKDKDRATTAKVERSEKADRRFGKNVDNDPLPWKQDNFTAKSGTIKSNYAIQSPFTGEMHYPGNRFWGRSKKNMKTAAEEWAVEYEECDLSDGKGAALVLKGWKPSDPKGNAKIIEAAKKAATKRLKAGCWPILYWGVDGLQKPVKKLYEHVVQRGGVPQTFWADDDDAAVELGPMSWGHDQSGRSRDGVEELTAIVGPNHKFETVKPLRLVTKIISLWCPPGGIVMDPFAGSGTTAHAVLELNAEAGASRRFILVEQGRPERGDPYARTLTYQRVSRAISGERVDKTGAVSKTATPLPGGFRYSKLMLAVDADAVLALEREEMLDLLLTSHWDQSERASSHLRRLPAGQHAHLFAVSARGEGFFLVWSGPNKPSVFDRATFKGIVEEAKAEGLSPPYHVYARTSIYPGPNIEFYQIPDRILDKLGFNDTTQPYSSAAEQVA
jgi:adenine-specific DNA-methyltransferase